MSLPRIAELLERHLYQWTERKDLPVAAENITFDAPDRPYVQSHVLPATNDVIDLSGIWWFTMVFIRSMSVCQPVGEINRLCFG